MTDSQFTKARLATDPNANIAVFASAGTGKTRLLVHRILKLLLNDVDPSHIVAITFTRKAAAEMRERLMKVLEDWAGFDDQQLQQALQELAHPHNFDSITKARKLYEQLLFAEYNIRITTFHAFCQDILKRFALHAGVPAGFKLVETTNDLKQEAREFLYKIAQRGTEPRLTNALYELLKHSTTVNNVNAILDTFIDSRSDWWCFTENQTDPIKYAHDCLRQYLFLNHEEINSEDANLIPALRQYQSYLASHTTPKFLKYCDMLTTSLEKSSSINNLIQNIIPVFLTKKNEPQQLKTSNALEKSLGQKNMTNLIQLHSEICHLIIQHLDVIKKENLLSFNQAWFYAGHRLLSEYQHLKFARHSLDFDDLEWYTYLLLNQHDNAAWIQYKLDQRIEHILIDEFQDTNPTQWNLLFPLLEELAANLQQSSKSLFFVGDTKQSIYGFRRANPQLQLTASEWAKQNLDAKLLETDRSFRSSPAIINFVNRVFSTNKKELLLDDFRPHDAAQSMLWGYVQIDPLIIPQDKIEGYLEFRNPLLQAKTNTELNCHYREGQAVAKYINKLIADSTPIIGLDQARAVRYSDIIVLARSRTHLSQLELALREQHIPYCSINDDKFLDQLEVQDILALLTYLIQSHNDLALVQVLRSPCFGVSDEDLMNIASHDAETWHEKLKAHITDSPTTILTQAYAQLQKWRDLVNRIPVHDLLDRIYFDINILTRYANSCAPTKKSHVIANLTHLLQLTLDLDAGRYSSIQSFLNSIQKPGVTNTITSFTKLNQHDAEAVQIMTIHAAKGLEAPVVFLIDTGSIPPKQRAYQTVINWPFKARRPEQFFIVGRKDNIDRNTHTLLNQKIAADWKEELNLLYVALTRAKQYLFISGVQAKQNQENSWFSIIERVIENITQDPNCGAWVFKHGTPPYIKTEPPNEVSKCVDNTIELSKPFTNIEKQNQDVVEPPANIAKLASHGTLIHKIFELIDRDKFQDPNTLRIQIESMLTREIDSEEFSTAIQEVRSCLERPELEEIFVTRPDKEILTEVPICFIENGEVLYRIIDRLIITEDSAWIIDFKTASEVKIETISEHATQYQKQISYYFSAVEKLYPSKEIRASILFTSIPAIYDYDVNKLFNDQNLSQNSR